MPIWFPSSVEGIGILPVAPCLLFYTAGACWMGLPAEHSLLVSIKKTKVANRVVKRILAHVGSDYKACASTLSIYCSLRLRKLEGPS